MNDLIERANPNRGGFRALFLDWQKSAGPHKLPRRRPPCPGPCCGEAAANAACGSGSSGGSRGRAGANPRAPERRSGNMEIKRSGSQPSGKGPADWFTGTVRIDPLFERTDPARVAGAQRHVRAGCAHRVAHASARPDADRDGRLRLGAAPRAARSRKSGPATWSGFRPAKSTGMGRRPTTAMTHIAIQEKLDGKAVDWMEKVSDEQYRQTLQAPLAEPLQLTMSQQHRKDKVVVITGASSGLGEATARLLSAERREAGAGRAARRSAPVAGEGA